MAGFGFSTIVNLSDGFNIGQNLSLVLTDNAGVIYNVGRVVRFTASPKGTEVDSKTIVKRGYIDHKYMREGWNGEITVDRTDGAYDDLEALQEVLMHQGGRQMYFQILTRILNDNGTVNEYQYNRCELHMTAGGNWAMDEKVEQTLSFRAIERVKLQ